MNPKKNITSIYPFVVVFIVLFVLKVLGAGKSLINNNFSMVMWKDMGPNVEGYGVIGGRIWGQMWKDMGL
ncbi:MAG: hypothetical protein ACOC2E_05555 [Bacteroidota bacterium]